MNFSRTLSGLAVVGALSGGMIVGCKMGSSEPPSTPPPASTPATQPSATIVSNQGKEPAPPVVMQKPAAASMTHVMTKDEPYYESMPAADTKSPGTLKSGTKVLLMVPGAPYSQVLTEDGATVYTMTDGIDPITTKK